MVACTTDAQQPPPSEVHISLNSENATSLQTYDDTRSTLHRAPVGQGPPGPDWLAISFGFWSGRALATGTAWAGLCLNHHHHHDTRTCLPPSFFRFSLPSDDDSELLHSEIPDVIFSEEQEMLLATTDQNVHDVEKIQNSWHPPDSIIDPDETVSESHEEIPLRVTAKYDRK